MSLKATIAAAVETAFSAVGDMVQKVTLKRKEDVEFDWTTGKYTSTDSDVTVEAIVTDTAASAGEESQSPTSTVVIRTRDVGTDFSFYNSLVIGGIEHRISSIEQYEGVTILKTRRG